ncbi:ParA family protein [Salidesulfovibrio brasiliensis]|uniref:ParA family protein n=1 Tax=Salidesulfovibrio brasiliensis TaxID=221711 RepID=UPI003F73074F
MGRAGRDPGRIRFPAHGRDARGRQESGQTTGRRAGAPRSRYDLIFLDCPPSISVLSESLFSLADYVFMPMLPTELSRRAFQQVQEHMEASKYATAEVVAFYNLVDRRKTLHRTNVLRGYAAQPELFCEASIPARTDIERMALEMKPLLEYAPDSDSAAAYGALWREIRRKTAMPAPRS